MTNFEAACDIAALEPTEPASESVELRLSGRWREDLESGAAPASITAWFDLRLGERAITAHFDPLPLLTSLTALTHGVADLLDGGRREVEVALGEERLTGVAGTPLRISLGLPDGRATVVDVAVDGARLRASVLATARQVLDATTTSGEGEALADAVDRLETLRRPRLPSAAVATGPGTSQTPSGRGPVGFGYRVPRRDGPARLDIRLGTHVVAAGQASLVELLESLATALTAAFSARNWPDGEQTHTLPGRTDHGLRLTRREGVLAASVVDDSGHALCPPVPVTLLELARAWRRVAEKARGHVTDVPESNHLRTLGREARELCVWAAALIEGDRFGPAEPPEGFSGPLSIAPAPAPEPLPVSGLHRVAYRRGWRREAPGLAAVGATETHLLVYDGGGLTALTRHDGVTTWHLVDLRPLSGAPAGYALTPTGGLVRFDPASGAQVWRARATAGGAPRRVHVGAEVVLLESEDRHLTAVDVDDGRRLWRRVTHYGAVLGVAAQGPLAWVVAEDDFVTGLSVSDGVERFRVGLGADLAGAPQLTGHGLLQAVHDVLGDESGLVMLDPLTGQTRWRRGLGGSAHRAPVVVGDAALVVIDDGTAAQVLRIDLADGATRWSHSMSWVLDTPLLQAEGDRVFAKSSDGSVCALSIADGAPLWVVDGDDPNLELMHIAPPVVARGVLLVPGTRVRVVDPQTGRVVQALDCGELVPGWLHAWPDGDLAIAEDEAVAHYLLGGHLALVG